MKSLILIIIAIIIVIAGYFLLSSDADDAGTENVSPETVVPNDAETAGAADAMNDMDEESDAETSENEAGSDAGMEFPVADKGGEEKVFTVDAFSFGYSMEEIRVAEGDTVTINLTNSGGLHDWVVDEFDAATARIGEGETTSVTFVASEAGTYEFYCSVGNHRERGMVGTLIVE